MQPDKEAVQAAAPLQMLVHAAGCCLGDETSRIMLWFDSRGGAGGHEGDGAAAIYARLLTPSKQARGPVFNTSPPTLLQPQHHQQETLALH